MTQLYIKKRSITLTFDHSSKLWLWSRSRGPAVVHGDVDLQQQLEGLAGADGDQGNASVRLAGEVAQHLQSPQLHRSPAI